MIRKLWLPLLLLLPMVANAENALAIPVLSFGKVYFEIFSAIAMLTTSTAYQNAITACIAAGFLGLVSRAAFVGAQGMLAGLSRMWLGALVVLTIGIKTTVPVQIADIPGNYYNAVQKVPLMIAYTEYFTHSLGYYIAEMVDDYYAKVSQVPKSLLLTGTPFALAPALVADASQYEVNDPYLKDSLTHFVVDCVYPQIYNGYISRHDLFTSHDLFKQFLDGGANPASMTVYYGTQNTYTQYGGAGKVMTCQEVAKNLESATSTIQANMLKSFGQYMSAGLDAAYFQNALNYYSGTNPYQVTPGELLMQGAMLGVFKNDAPAYAASKSDSQQIYQQLAIAQAKQNVFENWEVSAATFTQTWGYALVAIDLIILGLFPFVILFLFIPPLSHLFKSFIGLVMFVPAVDISIAIAQAIGTHFAFDALHPFFGQDGLTLQSQMYLSKQAINAKAAADSMLTWSVAIATGLCFGFNYVASKFGSSSNAVRESQQATDAAVKGNIAMDNRNWNNTAANKDDTTYTESIGAGQSFANITTAPTGVQNYGGQFARVNESPMTTQRGHTMVATHIQSGAGIVATSHADTLSNTTSQGTSSDHATQTTRAVSTSLSGSGIGAGAVMAAYQGLKGSFARTGFNFDSIPQQQREAIISDVVQGNAHAVQAAQAQAQGNMQAAKAEQAKSEGFFAKAGDMVSSLSHNPAVQGALVGALAVGAVTGIDEIAAGAAAVGGAAVAGARVAGSAISSVARSFGKLFGSRGEAAVEEAAATKGSSGYGFSAGGVKGSVGDNLAAETGEQGRMSQWVGKGKNYLKEEGAGFVLGKGASVKFTENLAGKSLGQDQISKESNDRTSYDQKSHAQNTNQTTDQWSVTRTDTEATSYQVPMTGGVNVQFMDGIDHPRPQSAVARAREIHEQYKARNAAVSGSVAQDGERLSNAAKADQDTTAGKEQDRFDSALQIGKS